MREVNIRLESIPIAWARPGQGPFGRYDTQKRIKEFLSVILRPQLSQYTTLTGPVECKAVFVFPLPKGKKGEEKMGLFHIKKPDLDNLLKFYLDLCKDNGVYKDDCQVCTIMTLKRYTTEQEDHSVGARLTFTEVSPNIHELVENINGKIATESGGVRFNKVV